MADDESLKEEMDSQIRAMRERGVDPRRTVFIEPGTHPAHAEVPAEPERSRSLIDRLLRRRD